MKMFEKINRLVFLFSMSEIAQIQLIIITHTMGLLYEQAVVI